LLFCGCIMVWVFHLLHFLSVDKMLFLAVQLALFNQSL
jgi:hypothetical protein